MEENYSVSGPSIDEILSKLTTRFNRIFCDREFVCCVNEDLQRNYLVESTVHEHAEKEFKHGEGESCIVTSLIIVVVFPVLGPSYLKAVRYQAKIFDLAVFALGTGNTRSIAVCQKEFLKKKYSEATEHAEEKIMPESASASECNKLRRKRPERQLYIPPAQRRLPFKEETPNNEQKSHNSRNKTINKKREDIKISKNKNITKELKDRLNDERCEIPSNDQCIVYRPGLSSLCILWKYQISKQNLTPVFRYFYEYVNYLYFKYYHYFTFYNKVPLYSCDLSSNNLYILSRDYVLWQPKLDVIYLKSDNVSANTRAYPLYNFKESHFMPSDLVLETKLPLVHNYSFEFPKIYDISEHRTFKVMWSENQCSLNAKDLIDLSVINSGHSFITNKNGCEYFYSCKEDHNILKCYEDQKKKDEQSVIQVENSMSAEQHDTELKKNIIIWDERFAENDTAVQKNNIKNSSPNIIANTNGHELIHSTKKSNEHEQEKEIMRKTKENINRKTRPIIKYIDDANNTLNIGRNDDVNNWEDLFDDNGQLQEDLFKDITHKVGTDVTIVKAKEDYSDYSEYVVPKQLEELEHMVELYDFPSTLGTHDIIQAFSDINSDAMYVKWVDDTHAILVLGSLTQAQRAIELDNPLIKVRPMTAASGMSLATAYKNDLKPAMKRPQTNLQTARRLITTHLGTKSRVSREQTTKERNDLKAAREMKKLAKKNEQDAWEGNLKSSAS